MAVAPPATHDENDLRGIEGRSMVVENLSMFFTYVLQSRIDNKYYVGSTNDLRKRLGEHNNGKVRSTKNRVPLDLVYYEACLDKIKAIKREKYFKTGFGRGFLKNRI